MDDPFLATILTTTQSSPTDSTLPSDPLHLALHTLIDKVPPEHLLKVENVLATRHALESSVIVDLVKQIIDSPELSDALLTEQRREEVCGHDRIYDSQDATARLEALRSDDMVQYDAEVKRVQGARAVNWARLNSYLRPPVEAPEPESKPPPTQPPPPTKRPPSSDLNVFLSERVVKKRIRVLLKGFKFSGLDEDVLYFVDQAAKEHLSELIALMAATAEQRTATDPSLEHIPQRLVNDGGSRASVPIEDSWGRLMFPMATEPVDDPGVVLGQMKTLQARKSDAINAQINALRSAAHSVTTTRAERKAEESAAIQLLREETVPAPSKGPPIPEPTPMQPLALTQSEWALLQDIRRTRENDEPISSEMTLGLTEIELKQLRAREHPGIGFAAGGRVVPQPLTPADRRRIVVLKKQRLDLMKDMHLPNRRGRAVVGARLKVSIDDALHVLQRLPMYSKSNVLFRAEAGVSFGD